MHQDQRIGLALGVLLVGACAAFFFRNEARIAPETPQLQRAQELDDRIAERSTRPYLKGVEAIEASDRRRRVENGRDSSAWNPLGAFSGKSSQEPAPTTQKPNRAKVENPNDVQELAPITISDDSQLASDGNPATNEESNVAVRSTNQSDRDPAERTHVVQKGETLTSIATKTLGNPSRFHDIFEANQDQLSDPNDVKLGMILRIPSSRQEMTSKPHVVRSRPSHEATRANPVLPPVHVESMTETLPPHYEPDSAEKADAIELPSLLPPSNSPVRTNRLDMPEAIAPADETETPRRFVPSKRLPLPGREYDPQTKTDPPRKTTGRRLSQVPPEMGSGKIAR